MEDHHGFHHWHHHHDDDEDEDEDELMIALILEQEIDDRQRREREERFQQERDDRQQREEDEQQSRESPELQQEIKKLIEGLQRLTNRSQPNRQAESDQHLKDASKSENPESDSNQCCVCYDKEPNTVLIPCGHVICDVCCSKCGECPVCRAQFSSTQRLYV